jgi:hypothetical protein
MTASRPQFCINRLAEPSAPLAADIYGFPELVITTTRTSVVGKQQ